jgi:hypothetical protein
VTFWKTVLGLNKDRVPYDSEVEYLSGTKGRIPVWACDGSEALILIGKMVPRHEQIVEIRVWLRKDWAPTNAA